MFETFIEEIDQRFELGDRAEALLAALLGVIFDHRTGGGVATLMARFRVQGLGDLFASWLDNPRARSIEPRLLEKMLSQGVTTDIARRLDVQRETALAALCMLLPKLIGWLTRNGALPTSMPADVRAYLDRLEPVSDTPDISVLPVQMTTDLTPRLGVFKWILAAAILLALGFYVVYRDTWSRDLVALTPPVAADTPPDTAH